MNNFSKLIFMSILSSFKKYGIATLSLIFVFSIKGNAQSANDPIYDANMNNYRVVAYMNQNDLITSFSNTISLEKPYAIYAPNAFSPDGDGVNDYFQIYGQGFTDYEIEIYNRWGQMVYKSVDFNEKWDGEFKGNKSPMGTYVYKVKTQDFGTDQKLIKSGTVALIR